VSTFTLHDAQKVIALDPHRFRVVCAGRRFGKSQLVIDQMKARAAIPSSRIAYIATCYDEQTEILTNKGWKFFKDLDKTELVGTYKDGGLVFERPKEYFIHDYEGELCGIKNNTIDQLVTPHHRCLVKNHRNGDWHIKTAEEIENTWVYRFKKTPDIDTSLSFPKDEEIARFWGWYISEGYSRTRTSSKNAYELIITQCKEVYIKEIRDILIRIGIHFTEQKRNNGGINFSICGNKELYIEAQRYGKSHEKYVPEWIKNGPPNIIKAFIETYWKGDGHIPNNNYDYRRAETKSKRLADDLQECLIKIGESATVRKIKGRQLWSISWLHKKFSTPLIRKNDYYRTQYIGKVYCVRVTSGILMVRRNGKHYFSGNTYQQARDICWMQLRAECEQAAKTINESRLEIVLVNGSTIVLRGWENIETLRGQKFDLVVIDEVAMMRNFAEMWQEVIRPTLTDNKGEGIFISTPYGFNHFYDLFNMELKDKDYKSFHYTSYDNPYLDPEELDKAKQEVTEDRFAQEYMADFRKTEGLVYKEFDRKVHVVKGDKKEWYESIGQTKVRLLGGVDFGFVHPAAVLTIEETSDGLYFVSEEWVHSGKTDPEIAEYASAQRFNYVYPDPANAGGIEQLKRHGCNVRDVNKGPQSIINGINIVRELFKSKRLFIHESCQRLILGLETYSYGENSKGGKVSENPIKEADDEVDALRYPLMMVFGKKILNTVTVRKPKFVSFNKRG